MGIELKPCPLCGSTDIACFAEYDGDSYDNEPVYRAVVGCRGCRETGCDESYDEEPCFGIEAYFRGDHPLIKDEEDHYLLEMEVPGIKKEDLKIAVRNGYLVVSASFNKKSDEGKGKYIHFERETGSFSRSFYVGENVRTKDVSAKSENGVLLITIPKKVEREDKDEFVQIQ